MSHPDEVWVIQSCPCGNEDPKEWVNVTIGVAPTKPTVMLKCAKCFRTADVKRIEYEGAQ